MDHTSQLCERALAWASLRADGELSELESALLDGHLGRCASCRTQAWGIETVAGALRAARLERPAQLAFFVPRSRTTRALRLAAAGAAVAVAAVAALLAPAGHRPAPQPVAMVASAESPDVLRELRRPGLVRSHLPRNRDLSGESV